eukprot:3934888-Rhodomonas_salina.1
MHTKVKLAVVPIAVHQRVKSRLLQPPLKACPFQLETIRVCHFNIDATTRDECIVVCLHHAWHFL